MNSELYQLDNLAPRRKKRADTLIQCFELVAKRGLVSVILKKRNWFSREATKYKEVFQTGDRSSSMFAVTNESQYPLAAKLITKISVWHFNNFVVIFGHMALIDELKRKHSEIKNLSILEIQEIIQTEIEGFFFPVDEELVVYGNDTIKEVMKNLTI